MCEIMATARHLFRILALSSTQISHSLISTAHTLPLKAFAQPRSMPLRKYWFLRSAHFFTPPHNNSLEINKIQNQIYKDHYICFVVCFYF